MNKAKFNAWLPSWFSAEQTQAWQELPIKGNWVAPHTEEYRQQYRDWYKKWGKRFPRPCIVDDYAELDRQKKHLPDSSTIGDA